MTRGEDGRYLLKDADIAKTNVNLRGGDYSGGGKTKYVSVAPDYAWLATGQWPSTKFLMGWGSQS